MSNESITQEELESALKRMGYWSTLHAPDIFENVKTHRDPAVEPYEFVRDAHTHVWQRSYDGKRWFRFDLVGDAVEDDVPVRPIRLLTAKEDNL